MNILWSGYGLMRESVSGLLDEADPETTKKIEAILAEETSRRGITFHELRHRHSGDGHLIDVHLLFPSTTPLAEAHRSATEIEEALSKRVEPFAEVHTHLEPLEEHDAAHRGGRRPPPNTTGVKRAVIHAVARLSANPSQQRTTERALHINGRAARTVHRHVCEPTT